MGKTSKGTSSFGGRKGKTLHIKCRRCGRRAYHVKEKAVLSLWLRRFN